MKKEDFWNLKSGAIIYSPNQDRIAILDNDINEFRAQTAASNLYGYSVEPIYCDDYLKWEIVDKNTPPKYMLEIAWWRIDKLEHFVNSKFK